MAEEKEYFKSGDIYISSTRAKFGNTTYAMSNLTSVSISETPAKNGAGVLLILIGVLIGFTGLNTLDEGISILSVGFILIIVGTIAYRNAKAKYEVEIDGASGKRVAYESHNKAFIEEIINAINESIINRG